jgi:glycosyltransferase involved in cell wall biosynthesis
VSGERRGILFVHGADEWYGSDVVLYDIVRGLEDTEFDPYVVVPDDVKSELPESVRLSGRLRALGIPVIALPLAVLRRRYMTPSGVVTIARRLHRSVPAVLGAVPAKAISLVHTHTATVLTGAGIASELSVPHVWHVSEMVDRPAIVRRALARHIARSADHVIAVSAAVADHLAGSTPAIRTNCEVIHNAIDPSPFETASGSAIRARLAISGPVVGMVGRVGTWKGQEVLLAAAPDILRKHPETIFLFVGGVLDKRADGVRALHEMANRLGIAAHVRFMGFEDDIASMIATMDVVVQPSVRPEPFGMTVLEAMAAGKPVVAAAHGGMLETVSQNRTGFLVAPGNSAAFGAAISVLLDDAALRARMGQAAKARIRTDFGRRQFIAAYLRVYRSM